MLLGASSGGGAHRGPPRGRRPHREIGPALQQGFWLAAMLALPGSRCCWPGSAAGAGRGATDVAALACRYLAATAAGLPALLFYRSFYAFNNAVGRPWR